METHPALARLLAMLDLERIDRNLYRAAVPDEGTGQDRLFGGQVAAQALRAATLTVEADHHVHSLHGYFLRPGQMKIPLLLHVERTRDGRSFSTRRVAVRQEGEVIFDLQVSFHTSEDGGEYEVGLPADIPDPDSDHDWHRSGMEHFADRMPFEFRDLGPTPADETGRVESTRRVWMKAKGHVPPDRDVQACLATFMSDMGAVTAAALSVAGDMAGLMGASLDHAVWFHRPIDMAEWFLYDLSPVSAHGARGLVRGTMIDRHGTHGISMAQEALIRPRRP